MRRLSDLIRSIPGVHTLSEDSAIPHVGATLRYWLALIWPTLPGRNVSGRALTRRERENW